MNIDESCRFAQVNIALPVEPLTSDRLVDFVALLERARALRTGLVGADRCPAEHGPNPYAFTLQRAFPTPGSRTRLRNDDNWFCPA